jgi:N utilization substance protein B
VSQRWKLSRMDAIDRAILRIACYEMTIKAQLPARVVINEAIEIAKRYGGEQSPSFVNAVLDSLYHSAQ